MLVFIFSLHEEVAWENSRHFVTPPNGFPKKWLLRNGRKNFHTDDSSASDWLKQISHAALPIRSTSQIWVVTCHQYEISALVSQMSFHLETVGDVVKYQLFSQATSSWSEWNVLPFCTHYQNNSTSCSGLLGLLSSFLSINYAVALTSFFTYHGLLPNLVNSCWLW